MITILRDALALICSGDSELLQIVGVSLACSLASVTVASLVAVPLSVALDGGGRQVRRWALSFFGGLQAVPTVVIGLVCYTFLSRSGPLGVTGLLFTPVAIIIGQTLLALPVVAAPLLGGLSRLDGRLRETLLTLGASPLRAGWAIIGECRTLVLAACLGAFGRVIGEVGVALMLGGNIRFHTRTMTTAIALETSRGEFQRGLALGIILLAIALVVNILAYRVVTPRAPR